MFDTINIKLNLRKMKPKTYFENYFSILLTLFLCVFIPNIVRKAMRARTQTALFNFCGPSIRSIGTTFMGLFVIMVICYGNANGRN